MAQNERNESELIRPGKETRRVGSLFELAEVLAPAVVCVVLLFTFVGRHAGVFGISMLPTLEEGQKLAVTAILLNPGRGDIVVLSPNNGHHEPLVKRVVAVAGDEIDIADGHVLVNGKPIEEPYLPEGTMTYPASASGMEYPVRVPAGCVFVMGDNRSRSSDSRSDKVGFVRADDILGRAVFRLKPFFKTKPFHFTYKVE